ncbi:MAG: YicC/YloC family endoribonuclease [Desulfuromonas sp.]
MNSMTGYGKGRQAGPDALYVVEIKTVNHRYGDITVKLPRALLFLEGSLRGRVSQRLARGKIDVYVSREPLAEGAVEQPALNVPLADAYMRLYREVAARYDLKAEVPLSLLCGQRDIVLLQEAATDEGQASEQLFAALDQALQALQAMRAREGAALAQDIGQRLEGLQPALAAIEARAAQVVAEWGERLRERIARLLTEVPVDEQRLAQEIALCADRCDISEEVVRFKSHLAQFRELLASDEPVGRQMDFLIQELNRETNTMGSKSNDAELTRQVVAIKAELEKMREQVQNVE